MTAQLELGRHGNPHGYINLPFPVAGNLGNYYSSGKKVLVSQSELRFALVTFG